MKNVGPVVFGAVLVVLGVVCIGWPHDLQRYYLRRLDRSPLGLFRSQRRKQIASPMFVVYMRATGVLALVMAGFLMVALMWRRNGAP
jgi:hypothetical protein